MRVADLDIVLRRKWIRTLRLTVKPDGIVHVSAPLLMPNAMIEAFILERLDWIHRAQERAVNQPKRVLHEVTPEQQQALVNYLQEAVPRWCRIMEEEPVEIRIRNMKSQWGNCRWRERRITFNLQLALVPHELVDYIIVHELAHLQVQNHGPLFHERVQRFIPDEKVRRRTLNHFRT